MTDDQKLRRLRIWAEKSPEKGHALAKACGLPQHKAKALLHGTFSIDVDELIYQASFLGFDIREVVDKINDATELTSSETKYMINAWPDGPRKIRCLRCREWFTSPAKTIRVCFSCTQSNKDYFGNDDDVYY